MVAPIYIIKLHTGTWLAPYWRLIALMFIGNLVGICPGRPLCTEEERCAGCKCEAFLDGGES